MRTVICDFEVVMGRLFRVFSASGDKYLNQVILGNRVLSGMSDPVTLYVDMTRGCVIAYNWKMHEIAFLVGDVPHLTFSLGDLGIEISLPV